MRLFVLATVAVTAFTTAVAYIPTDANAAVCAKGVVRAGCAGPNGAVVAGPNGAAVVRAPVVVCRYVIVNSVRVRRCT